MELKDYLDILNRRKWVILITIVAALGAVFIGTRLQTPIYESFVTLRAAASSTGELGYSFNDLYHPTSQYHGSNCHKRSSIE